MEKGIIENKLIQVIEEVLPELGQVDLKKNIVADYGINSISIIRIIVAVEAEFDVSFTDYELALDDYRTFDDLARLLTAKLDDLDA